jgi:hypothetical protein
MTAPEQPMSLARALEILDPTGADWFADETQHRQAAKVAADALRHLLPIADAAGRASVTGYDVAACIALTTALDETAGAL